MPTAQCRSSDSDLDSVLSMKILQPPKPRRNSLGPKYFCSIDGCGEFFKRLDHLDRHEYHHTGVKKHICTYDGCAKAYSILTHLKRHLRTTHERAAPPQKNVSCEMDFCKKLFSSVSNMQRHVREVHENPKIYKCSFCAETFTQKLKMRRHEIGKHSGEHPYSCSKCKRGFYQQSHYESHMENCKIYPCANCTEQFEKWTLYLKHCKEMHGRKYYQCEQCSARYARPGELRKHVAEKHLNDVYRETFKCTQQGCEREYAYERNLRQHLLIAHRGKRFKCAVAQCGRFFSSAQNLAKHKAREHSTKKRKASEELEDDVDAKQQQHATGEKKLRKKRKDAGQTRSALASLVGLCVPKELDKKLRERDEQSLKTVENALNLNILAEQVASNGLEKKQGVLNGLEKEQAVSNGLTKEQAASNGLEKEQAVSNGLQKEVVEEPKQQPDVPDDAAAHIDFDNLIEMALADA